MERVAHEETRQKLKELIVATEDGVSPKDVSRSPVFELGGERDVSTASSAASSMTEFREVKLTADGLIVEQEVKSQLDKDVSCSPVIELGGEIDASIASSAASSMTEFREVKLTADGLRVELEVKNQLDKDRTHTLSEVGGCEKQLKNKWALEFKGDETITIIEVGVKKRAEAQAEIGAEEAIFHTDKHQQISELDDRVANADRWSGQ